MPTDSPLLTCVGTAVCELVASLCYFNICCCGNLKSSFYSTYNAATRSLKSSLRRELESPQNSGAWEQNSGMLTSSRRPIVTAALCTSNAETAFQNARRNPGTIKISLQTNTCFMCRPVCPLVIPSHPHFIFSPGGRSARIMQVFELYKMV